MRRPAVHESDREQPGWSVQLRRVGEHRGRGQGNQLAAGQLYYYHSLSKACGVCRERLGFIPLWLRRTRVLSLDCYGNSVIGSPNTSRCTEFVSVICAHRQRDVPLEAGHYPPSMGNERAQSLRRQSCNNAGAGRDTLSVAALGRMESWETFEAVDHMLDGYSMSGHEV